MRWIKKRLSLSPVFLGALLGGLVVIAFGLFLSVGLSSIAEQPSAELLRYMAAIGSTLLIAYAIEFASLLRDPRPRSWKREVAVGAVVGIAGCGLAGIVLSLALGERAEVHHWSALDELLFGLASCSLFFLAWAVVLLPLDAYEQSVERSDPDGD